MPRLRLPPALVPHPHRGYVPELGGKGEIIGRYTKKANSVYGSERFKQDTPSP